MQKSQIVVLALSITFVGVLYSLPKVIVSDKNKVLATDSTTANTLPNTSEVHGNALTKGQIASIDKLRNNLLNSTDKEKKVIFADSLANLFEGASQYDSSASYLETIANYKPSVQIWTRIGDSYYKAFTFATDGQKAGKMGEKAREYYQKVLQQKPDELDVKAKMAMTYVSTSSPMQGIALLREVLQKDPNNELALFNLGLLSMQSGQYDKAVDRFEQVVKRNPANDQAQFYLGISYAEKGDKEKAIQILKTVKQKNKDAAVQTTVDEYLEKLK